MNDWSNDTLKPGDLVHVWSQARSPVTGIVVSLNTPPKGSLQVYDAQVLIDGAVVNVYRQNMHRISSKSESDV
jgi:hypothetical protein